ncbi:hypothetical protein BDZ97DRAFT_1901936 [Flammula alnicola]|nr:hypothetical protein BDZ97DRAFT_1901936 [Flammula alnicola]
MDSTSSANSPHSSGFPEEDLRQAGINNPGYFLARLGGRFVIVRKLGWGQYSSVWLAKDKKDDRFVALKILTCEVTSVLGKTGNDKRSDELCMLQKITAARPEHRDFKHNITLYNSFEFHGPHGKHLCILDYIRKLDNSGDRRLSVALTKRLAKQIPYVCPPVIPIISQRLPTTTSPLRLDELEAVIADVGHSLHSPEVILGYPRNAAADIWNFGCLKKDHLVHMTEALGTTFDPAFVASKCSHGSKFFDVGSSAHFTTHKEPIWPLNELLDTVAIYDAEQCKL